ncbi:MAG: efflux RND transporter permease subunit [Deltaproteobacteria bacterium]|nr:efflux RND transporter permease subunit [Deltaproteobacteria bacterium]
MRNAVRWMAHNHVAANLLMLLFVVGGLIMGGNIKQEIFPEVNLDRIIVSVAYPGAGPEEIEDGIILKIEDNLTEVDGIREIQAIAREGMGTVIAVLQDGADAGQVLQDIKNAVDRIITFPEDAEEPVVSILLNRHEVISVVVYGDLEEKVLRQQAEMIRDELLEYPQITQVDLGGVRPYEISVEIPETNLRRYNLTLEQVAARIRRASIDLPGGEIRTAGGLILIRTKEKRYFGPQYADIVIIARPDGTEVTLGDLGEIRDTFAETDIAAKFNNQPAAMVKIFRVGSQKPTEISRIVNRYLEKKRALLPGTVKLAVWNDTSEMLRSRMGLLRKNAFYGLILVFITLGLFLEISLALWVMLGIPISFLGALFLMPAMDVSVNMISLFGFIMALGIVVDDAIVVGENVYAHRQLGKVTSQAAVDGALEVAGPVTFSVLTTIVAFLPLLCVQGVIGKFIRQIPLVVITILTVSLLESIFVLPSHLTLGRAGRRRPRWLAGIDRLRLVASRGLRRLVNGPYRRFLRLSLRYRYTTVAAAVAAIMLTVGLVGGGLVKFRFMPRVEGDIVTVSLEMPQGTPAAQTAAVLQRVLDQALATIDEFNRDRPAGQSILRHLYSVVGSTIAKGGPEGSVYVTSSPSIGEIALVLVPGEKRQVTTEEVERRWREKVGELSGVESLVFSSNLVHMGSNIDIQLAHTDYRVLKKVSRHLQQVLGTYPGVTDISDNFAPGKKELKIRLKPAARTLGITEADLGRQIRSAYYGAEALRLQRGRNEVKVMVRYPESDRRQLASLENLRIRTPAGGEIPLSRAAWIIPGHGYSEIHRTNRKRVIDVTASVDAKQANAEEILADLRRETLPRLKKEYPGLSYSLEGEEKERRDSMASMKKGFLLALIGIYALLAIPFGSYLQPLLIMTAIPFGVIGAILGHLLMGFDLCILSLFGIVALAGVVVNDSLLLIHTVNTYRRRGKTLLPAVIAAACRRFRPIMLTSLTTFFGLFPMIMEKSFQAQFLIPMAISLGFGIMFATGITLVLIPSLYLILEDLIRLAGGRRQG